MASSDRIEINPKVMLGKPVIRGTRIPIELLLRKLGEGASEQDILVSYPSLTQEDIRAAITYAADVVAHEAISLAGPIASQRPAVRFLADESCDAAVVYTLRAAGHDVLAAAEISPRADDTIVIDLATNESRILLTEDRDFGQLVYASALSSGGVIYMRYPATAQNTLPQDVLSLVTRNRDPLVGHFVVLQPGRTRISRLP